MKNQINVEGIRLYAYHGCLPEETKIGGEYIVDVYMVYDFHEAAVKDDLNLNIGLSRNNKIQSWGDRDHSIREKHGSFQI